MTTIERNYRTATLLDGLVLQARVVGALILRETRSRFGHSRVGYLWAVLEPVAHVAAFAFIFTVMQRRPPVGESIYLFLVTGLVPYFLYEKTASRCSAAITANRALLNLPPVRNVDCILARALLEFATMVVVGTILVTVLVAAGTADAIPYDFAKLLQAFGAIFLLGLGVGSVNAVINAIFKTWDQIFRIMTRPLYFFSGIMFSPEKLPEGIRDIILWNPVLHGVEWFRTAFYPGYGSYTLSPTYILSAGFAALVVGLSAERALRRKMFA